jgi:thymidylate synthase
MYDLSNKLLPKEVLDEYENTFYLLSKPSDDIYMSHWLLDGLIDIFKDRIDSITNINNLTVYIIPCIISGLPTDNAGLIKTEIRSTNINYCRAELNWYLSQSLSVDMIEKYGKIWGEVCNKYGKINSNYGWCIFSNENHKQYENAVRSLEKNMLSRQASMIYTRPTMHRDSCEFAMKDFMCTCYTQLVYDETEDILKYNVHMRSNDFIFGFFNDFFWHAFVSRAITRRLGIGVKINWIADNMHVYKRHYKLFTK